MALTKLPGFTLDSTSNTTFANTTVTGNLTSGNANLGNLATANYFSGSGNLLSNIQVANVTGLGNLATVNKDGNSSNILYGNGIFASAPVTYGNSNVVTLLSSYGSNTIVTTGNITGGNIIGIIAAGSNTITTTGNVDVGNLGFGSGVITGTGNITAGNANLGNLTTSNYFSGNGSLLTSLTGGNVTGQVGNALVAGTVYTASQPNITSVGTLSSLTVTANANVGNLNATTAVIASTLTSNVATGTAPLTVTSTTKVANLNADMLEGYHASITNGANTVVIRDANSNITGNNISGTLSTASQPNITSIGLLSSLGVTGNITSGNANLGNLTTSNYFAGVLTTAAQPNITSLGSLTGLTITGNLTVSGSFEYANVSTFRVQDPIIEQGGNTAGGALTSNDGFDRGQLLHYYSDSSAVDAFMGWDNSNAEFAFASNVTVASEVATFNSFGNVRANVYFGNGSQLTGISTSYAIANGTSNISIPAINGNINLSSAGNANIMVVTGTGVNIAGYADLGTGNLTTAGNVSFSGANVTLGAVGNLHVTGGTANQYLKTDGSGTLSWGTPAGGGGAGLTYTAATTPAVSPNVADQWYNTTTNVLYEYVNDGSANYWVDIQTPSNSSYVTSGYVNRSYTADGSGRTYTVTLGCGVNDVLVFLNGICQMPTTDYTISGTTLTLDVAPTIGVKVQIRELPR